MSSISWSVGGVNGIEQRSGGGNEFTSGEGKKNKMCFRTERKENMTDLTEQLADEIKEEKSTGTHPYQVGKRKRDWNKKRLP